MRMIRRSVLALGVGVAAVALISPVPVDARDLTAAEKANVQVVKEFSDAWATGDADKVTSFLADDVVVRFLQTQEPVKGRTVVNERLKKGMANSKIEFEILETFAAGPLVSNLRIDYITAKDGKRNPVRVAGVFYLRGGKIVEWIDAVVESK
jgi:limonene-1,2-epoxide hydrolase